MKKLLVFTDLDGTLLDHQTYEWQAASEAIDMLHVRQCPLIFNSSKTQAEMQLIAQQMHNHAPMICENGSSIAAIAGLCGQEHDSVCFGADYRRIVTILHEIRQQHGWRFTGFSDMDVETVMEKTGLGHEQALLAMQRRSSEPLQWQDSEAALVTFEQALQQQGLTLARGGRFYSVSGQCSKGEAVRWLVKRYRQYKPDFEWISVGLGDSANDVPMLENVDYPVLVSNPHARPPAVQHIPGLIRPGQVGPCGWNSAVKGLIERLL